ncbi:MAG: DUF1127 domain-containing protein [Deltaproteobacteria bacterium]|nr:DUF1127 domain-containing protein [Deltaproteobacteria bacterium]
MSTMVPVDERLSPELVLPQISQWRSMALLRLGAQIGWILMGRGLFIVRQWRNRAMQRRQLMMLNPRLLKDVGLTQADAYRESLKPFWRE